MDGGYLQKVMNAMNVFALQDATMQRCNDATCGWIVGHERNQRPSSAWNRPHLRGTTQASMDSAEAEGSNGGKAGLPALVTGPAAEVSDGPTDRAYLRSCRMFACRIPHCICCMSYVVCVVRCILASSHVALSHGLLRRMVYVASSHVVYCMLHLARSVTRRVRTRVAHRTLSCAGRHGMGHCGCDGTWHVRVACADPATWQVSAARRGQR